MAAIRTRSTNRLRTQLPEKRPLCGAVSQELDRALVPEETRGYRGKKSGTWFTEAKIDRGGAGVSAPSAEAPHRPRAWLTKAFSFPSRRPRQRPWSLMCRLGGDVIWVLRISAVVGEDHACQDAARSAPSRPDPAICCRPATGLAQGVTNRARGGPHSPRRRVRARGQARS